MQKLIPLLAVLTLLSCSSDTNFDDSVLRKSWHLSSLQLSQPVDLNLDGIASTDMLLEMPCMATESFWLSSVGNTFSFYMGDYVTYSNDGGASWLTACVENGGLNGYGTFRAINGETLELRYEHSFNAIGFEPYTKRFKIEENKLVLEGMQFYRATFDQNTQTWTTAEMFVRREYTSSF